MADVELLPLPEPGMLHVGEPSEWFTADQMRAYARANTASLQAENERLRAEVERLQDSVNRLGLEGGQFMSRTASAEARADDLAEALRNLAANWDERCNTVLHQARDADESDVSQYHITAGALAGCARELRAAIAQEDRNG